MRRIALVLAAAAAFPQAGASAAELQPDAQVLAQLEVRDRILLNHGWGRAFTEAYYRNAPLALLPIAGPEEFPQKLAVVGVRGVSDGRNFETYLRAGGYHVELVAPEGIEEALRRGEPQLLVAEFDADREASRAACTRLSTGRPGLAVVLAAAPGTGASATPSGEDCLSLPFVEPTPFLSHLARIRKEEPPLPGLRLLIRAGSCPVLLLSALLLAAGLAAGALLRGFPGRWPGRAACLAWILGMAAAAHATALDLLPASPEQAAALRTFKGIRSRGLEAPGRPLSQEALEALARGIASSDVRIRREAAYTWAVAALCAPGDLRGVDPLLLALEDDAEPGDPRRRQWAALALGFCGDPRAVPRLIAALEDPQFLVRNKAAVALGLLRDRRAIGPLFERTQKDVWYNAVAAREALARMGR